MRFFKNAFAAAAVVAMGVVGVFAQSENVVVSGIQNVTIASGTLQVSVSELSVKNFPSKGSVSGLPLTPWVAFHDTHVSIGNRLGAQEPDRGDYHLYQGDHLRASELPHEFVYPRLIA